MNTGLVSIVIPVFNVQDYLNRSVKSVARQSYKNLEIILVDDGSTDNSSAICDEWAKKDERIKVIHKQNAGLGMARNTGIENATGDFITFVDSDDYLDENAIKKAYGEIAKYDANIAIYGFKKVAPNGEIKKENIPKADKNIYEGKEVTSVLLPDLLAPDTSSGRATNLWLSSSGCLISLKIIKENGFRFVSEREIISEDVYSLIQLYSHINKAVVIPEAFYYYCENSASLTHTYREDRFKKIKYCYDETIKLSRQLNYSVEVEKRLAYKYISNTIGALKLILRSNEKRKNKAYMLRSIVSDMHLQEVLKSYDYSHESFNRRALLIAIKNGNYPLVYLLVLLKS